MKTCGSCLWRCRWLLLLLLRLRRRRLRITTCELEPQRQRRVEIKLNTLQTPHAHADNQTRTCRRDNSPTLGRDIVNHSRTWPLLLSVCHRRIIPALEAITKAANSPRSATELFLSPVLLCGTVFRSTSRQRHQWPSSPVASSLISSGAASVTSSSVVPEKCHCGHVNRFCYLLTYLPMGRPNNIVFAVARWSDTCLVCLLFTFTYPANK